MGRKGGSGMHLVLCLVFAGLALWPVAPVEALLDRLALATRPLLSVSRPFWPMGRVHADEGELADRQRVEWEESQFLEQWVRDQAVPRSVHMEGGVTLHAEAVGRPKGGLDTLLVRTWRSGITSPGMPVTTGDHYLGLVRSVQTRRGRDGEFDDVTVELITSGPARVNAGVMTAEDWQRDTRFVVGGLLAAQDFGLGAEREVLAVHHPSNVSLTEGPVLVNEEVGGERDLAWLANGFKLGNLRMAPKPEKHTRMDLLGVVPSVDFESGIYQVLIHTGQKESILSSIPEEDGSQGRWFAAQRTPLLDGAPWREGFKLTVGSRYGVQVGAAVASGNRLVGRVLRAGLWHADVVGPGDRSFGVPALALWLHEDAEHPTFVLGRVRSLGRDNKGRLWMNWPAALPNPGDEPARARIFTGSGDPGVPRGLLIGEAEIPIGPGPHRILIEPPEGSDTWDELRYFQFEEPRS